MDALLSCCFNMEVQRTSKQLASYMYGKSIKKYCLYSCYLQYSHRESLGTTSFKVRKKEMILNYLWGVDEWERSP